VLSVIQLRFVVHHPSRPPAKLLGRLEYRHGNAAFSQAGCGC
jgi:hypothetical protein